MKDINLERAVPSCYLNYFHFSFSACTVEAWRLGWKIRGKETLARVSYANILHPMRRIGALKQNNLISHEKVYRESFTIPVPASKLTFFLAWLYRKRSRYCCCCLKLNLFNKILFFLVSKVSFFHYSSFYFFT